MSDPAADRQAIVDLIAAYGRSVDAGDFDALRCVFTPDATAELGGSGQRGVDEIVARLTSALAPYARTEHRIGDPEVIVGEGTATATSPLHAVHVRPEGEVPPVYTVVGRYDDRLARTAEGWRITHRRLIVTRRTGAR